MDKIIPFITCQRCSQTYNLTTKLPKVLPCSLQHTLCLACVKQCFVFQEGVQNIVECPICKSYIEHKNLDKLENNLIIYQLIEQFKEQIKNHKTKEIDTQQVQKTFVPNEMLDCDYQDLECQYHYGKKIILFCANEFVGFCSICVEQQRHLNCKFYDFQDAFQYLQIAVNSLKGTLQEKVQKCKQSEEIYKGYQSILDQEEAKYNEKVQQIQQNLVSIINKKACNAIKDSKVQFQEYREYTNKCVLEIQKETSILRQYMEQEPKNLFEVLSFSKKVQLCQIANREILENLILEVKTNYQLDSIKDELQKLFTLQLNFIPK